MIEWGHTLMTVDGLRAYSLPTAMVAAMFIEEMLFNHS
jgi:hypothetical protein